MPRPPREVTLDSTRGDPSRIPILLEGRGTLDFGEPVVGVRDGRPVHGMAGWDPSLGWVLIVDRPVERDRPDGESNAVDVERPHRTVVVPRSPIRGEGLNVATGRSPSRVPDRLSRLQLHAARWIDARR